MFRGSASAVHPRCFPALAASSATPPEGGVWFSKLVGGVAELFYKDKSGNEVQLTSNGGLRGESVYLDSTKDNYFPRVNALGGITPVTYFGAEDVYDFGNNIPSTIADRNAICLDQAVTDDFLTLNGVEVVGGAWTAAAVPVARYITIYSPDDLSGCLFNVTGTDHLGRATSEPVTGPNGSTKRTLGYFRTVTSVDVMGAATNVEVGTGTVLFVCDISTMGKHFRVNPANNVNIVVGMYGQLIFAGGAGDGRVRRASVRVDRPAGGTFAWANLSEPNDSCIWFAGGVEPVPTAGGKNLFELAHDEGLAAPGYGVWYGIKSALLLMA